jgi:hypothetical protein
MSILMITDPNKRDYLVQELLHTRHNTKECSLSNYLGRIRINEKYFRKFKPVIEKLEALPYSLASSVAKVFKPTLQSLDCSMTAISTALAALPSNISDAIWLQLPISASEFTLQAGWDSSAPLEIEDIATSDGSISGFQFRYDNDTIFTKYRDIDTISISFSIYR